MPKTCRTCRHYYVTWDPRAPHGCRAMNFRSQRLPVLVVRETSAQRECLSYHPKETLKKRHRPKP